MTCDPNDDVVDEYASLIAQSAKYAVNYCFFMHLEYEMYEWIVSDEGETQISS